MKTSLQFDILFGYRSLRESWREVPVSHRATWI